MAAYKKLISRPAARKLFNSGVTVWAVPCKCRFDMNNPWIIPIRFDPAEKEGENAFERMVNEAVYYNCNSELGYYLHFYVEEP